jgi:type II secretory pathway pseudopilin PulG
MKKQIKTINVSDVISVTSAMGDSLATQYNKTNDLKVAQIALNAYQTAISGAKAQVIYKKLTGSPQIIKFLE